MLPHQKVVLLQATYKCKDEDPEARTKMVSNKVLLLLLMAGAALAEGIALQEVAQTNVGLVEGCSVDCTKPDFRRHPSDCNKYIQCAPSGPVVMPCPEGTIWDQDLLTCNHETALDCTVGFYKFPGRRQRCSGSCQFECPRNYGHFAHPRDCRKYFRCKNGVALYRQCAKGKHFDEATSTCVVATSATCNASPDADC